MYPGLTLLYGTGMIAWAILSADDDDAQVCPARRQARKFLGTMGFIEAFLDKSSKLDVSPRPTILLLLTKLCILWNQMEQ